MTYPDELSDAGRRLLTEVERIGREVAGPCAADVDTRSRFPSESVDALRAAGVLGALVPESRGGSGCSYVDIAAMCTALGKHCASSAMVLAMHQIQVACVVEHGDGHPYFEALMEEIARTGCLIASATSEAGIGGDVRSSICAVEREGDCFKLEKAASVVSYGEHVDHVLVTARRAPDAPASDQVIVHVRRPDLQLERLGDWDALGMRGTRSVPMRLFASGSVEQILPVPYAAVSGLTMLPVSHVTWASLWLGIAESAVDTARRHVRAAARRTPGTLPASARRLAETYANLERTRATVDAAVRSLQRSRREPGMAGSMSFAVQMNDLKITVSHDVVAIVEGALRTCGFAGYQNDSPSSLGRHLRDANSAALMVNNDRILDHNATLLCLMKD